MSCRDPHSYTDLEQGRVVNMDLDLTVDFNDHRMSGTATLDLAAPVAGPLDLDTRDLEIRKVATTDGTEIKWELGDKDEVMGSRLRLDLPAGTQQVVITYATSPTASALQWLEPAQTDGGKHPYLFSQCQAIHARSVIPAQDSPLARFTFHAKMTVPAELTVVMGAAPGEASAADQAGLRSFNFEMPQAIPPYLFAFAVGNIVAKDLAPRSRVYTEPETLEKAAYEFAEVDRMLTAAEEVFGPYLWDRFDFLVMPSSFPYGGMENPRLTFLTPTLLAGDRSLVNVLAHELAHSWTGNLVTNASIDDFWLNEGFTVWAERRILENLDGAEAKSLGAAIGRNGLDEALAEFGPDSPFTRLKTDGKGHDPDDFYSLVPYEKGFLLVSLFEQAAGREEFAAFIRKYIEHFRFTSITTEEFLEFLDKELPGVAEKVDAKKWIYQSGLPDNAPVFNSAKLEELKNLAAGWSDGLRPSPNEAKDWTPEHWQIFLQDLPRKMSEADCRWLDENFHLTEQGNAEILSNWLIIAASSGYEPAFERIASFLSEVGRMKYLKPLYSALYAGEKTKTMAVEIFADNAGSYHPIARGGLERILAS